MPLIALHAEAVHRHDLKRAQIALGKALAHDLGLNLTRALVDLYDVLGCAIVDFEVLRGLLDSESLVLDRSDQLSPFV